MSRANCLGSWNGIADRCDGSCFQFYRSRGRRNGAKLYNANKCASCHGPDGSANVPAGKALKARDFHSPDVQGQSDADLAAVIASGKNKMPAYGKQLKPDEIAELAAYSRALGKK